jgi:hypothetical protein
MTLTTSATLVATRESWHRVAEHVLAAGQFAAEGDIRLRAWSGGFATAVGVDGRHLAVVADRIVVLDGDRMRSQPLTTLRAAARFAGVPLGLRGSYPAATAADPDAPLHVDAGAGLRLADWFALGDAALRRVGGPGAPVLWPEHFDLGVTVDAVNYGASPGDAARSGPYLYVGPHEGPTSAHAYWNEPYGAALDACHITTEHDAVAFFSEGRARIRTERGAT